jgi:UPF0271 protein
MGVASKEIARAVAEAVFEVDDEMILVGLSGSVWIEAGEEIGLKVAREIFADRALNPDGTLVSRSQPGSVIEDPEQVVAASLQKVLEQKTTAIDGQEIPVKADTICLHGDTPGAVELARKLRERMEEAGIRVIPVSKFI